MTPVTSTNTTQNTTQIVPTNLFLDGMAYSIKNTAAAMIGLGNLMVPGAYANSGFIFLSILVDKVSRVIGMNAPVLEDSGNEPVKGHTFNLLFTQFKVGATGFALSQSGIALHKAADALHGLNVNDCLTSIWEVAKKQFNKN